LRPSTADSTEIAGVITASPKKNAAPAMPSPSSRDTLPWATRWPSAIRAKMPPSPSLSARSSTTTYFNVTISVSAQRMSESTPTTASRGTAPLA
jgi:hypothetical protein